jgi:hypothetical protein
LLLRLLLLLLLLRVAAARGEDEAGAGLRPVAVDLQHRTIHVLVLLDTTDATCEHIAFSL